MSDADFRLQEERRRVLVQNERRKLAANALDRLSTASVGAGLIAPMASFSGSVSLAGPIAAIVVSTIAWLSAALTLHFLARQQLGKLRL
ncbi:hypothetical protein SAMN05880590_10580 [Rhizobium sp. RU35A]|uniref:Uncharacterized protein n=1 Tax=Rhizobium straminoryzae TaxID=1387186 RepID=A0A549T6M0_9HYPH|nr:MULTISPECIES: hypothetical protein [Rhizobium]TRL37496.1 hypothetical protein FNA46_15430 [Rhizobium straminoryzae]SIQ54355.1 hypothetical protein SAMN05880590_10580 [Rhizobium sp. RU35A]